MYKLGWLIDSGNFSVMGYPPLPERIVLLICMVSQFMWKKDFFWTGLFSRKLTILMFSTGFTWLSALLLFLYQSPSSFLCMVFYSISSNIDQFLLVNPSAHVFFFGDFNVHHKDWLSYSGGTDRLFPSQMTLLGWLTFLLGFLIAIRTVLLFGINLFPLMLVFVLQWYGFPFIGKFLSSGCLSFHWLSNKLKTGCPVSFAGS